MKNFMQICAQLERIHKLYCKGYGSRQMIEKCEKIFFSIPKVTLLF